MLRLRVSKTAGKPALLHSLFWRGRTPPLFKGEHAAERAAANYAAKEAFGKALGIGIRAFALSEVQVLRDNLGAPYFSFSGEAARMVKARGLSFFCSLTHTKDYAQAIVIAQEE